MHTVVFSSVLYIVCISTTVVVGQSGYFPYMELNGGKEEANKACTKDEWADVLKEVFAASSSSGIGGRELSTTTTDQCACGLCIFTGKGCAKKTTRRRRGRYLKDPDPVAAAVYRNNTDQCQKEVAIINATLNDRARSSGKYSTSCKALLASSRKFTCREPAPCIIDYITLWDTRSKGGTILRERMPSDGQRVCQSIPITFQAMVGFDNGQIRFELFKSSTQQPPIDTRIDFEAPYYMYGQNGTQIIGQSLTAGEYFLTVSAVNYTNTKTFAFRVESC